MARWALRGDGSDSGRLLLGAGGLLLGATTSLALWGAAALLGWAALVCLALLTPQRETLDAAPGATLNV